MEGFTGKTVILADGDFPSAALPLRALEGAVRVVCCDRAAEGYAAHGFGLPAAVVGDLDSLSPASRERFASVLVHDPGQEDNDLSKAFRHCLQSGWRDIAILGATGRREDHAIGNVALLADFADETPGIAMLTDSGVFTVVRAPGGAVATEKGMQISFFSFDPRQPIHAEGVVYPVDGLRLRRWNAATLNEATGASVRLSFDGSPLLVYRAFLPGPVGP